MFDWLFEGWLIIYLLLALAAVALLIGWRRTGDRRYLRAVYVVAGAALLYFLLDLVHTTPREKVRKTMDAIVAALNRGDVKQAFEHFSERFEANARNKKQVLAAAQQKLKEYSIRNITIKSYRVLSIDVEAGKATVEFNVTADSNLALTWAQFRCEVDLVLEGEEWRVKTFRFYSPFADGTVPIDPFSL